MQVKRLTDSTPIDMIGLLTCLVVMLASIRHSYHNPEIAFFELSLGAVGLFLCVRIIKRTKGAKGERHENRR